MIRKSFRFQTHSFRPLRAIIDPRDEFLHLLMCQAGMGLSLFQWRHLHVLNSIRDVADQLALRAMSRRKRRHAALSAFDERSAIHYLEASF